MPAGEITAIIVAFITFVVGPIVAFIVQRHMKKLDDKDKPTEVDVSPIKHAVVNYYEAKYEQILSDQIEDLKKENEELTRVRNELYFALNRKSLEWAEAKAKFENDLNLSSYKFRESQKYTSEKIKKLEEQVKKLLEENKMLRETLRARIGGEDDF